MIEEKKKRRRSAPAMVHTAVVLPPDMIERLKQSERGLSEEIRRRLERSLAEDAALAAIDPETQDLIEAVAWMADQLQRDTSVPWHYHQRAHEALSTAFQTYFASLKPPLSEGPPGVTDLFLAYLADDPQTLGRAIARHYVRFKEELRKSEAELRELHSKGKKP